MLNNLITPIANNINNTLTQEFTSRLTGEPILHLLSTSVTDYEYANAYLITLTFHNHLLDDEDDLQFLNEDDIEDISGLIIDSLNNLPESLSYFTHSITPITCKDTALPYQAIVITISIEYGFSNH